MGKAGEAGLLPFGLPVAGFLFPIVSGSQTAFHAIYLCYRILLARFAQRLFFPPEQPCLLSCVTLRELFGDSLIIVYNKESFIEK
jgi:hypothetical protein